MSFSNFGQMAEIRTIEADARFNRRNAQRRPSGV
jgi:hypothetical protein